MIDEHQIYDVHDIEYKMIRLDTLNNEYGQIIIADPYYRPNKDRQLPFDNIRKYKVERLLKLIL